MGYKAAAHLQKFLMRAPESLLILLGRLLGVIMYLQGRRRKTAFKSIKEAFPEKSNGEIYRILRRNFFNFGLSFIESFVPRRLYKHVNIEGESPRDGEGGIYIGVHAGSWELANCFFAQHCKYAVLTEPQKNKGLDAFLNEMRINEKMRVCSSTKEIIRCIKNNYSIGMVVDHGLEDNAPVIDFFSHKVPTPRGAVYLARRFNKKLYPCFSYRENGFSLTIKVGKAIETIGRTDEEVLTEINKLYQEYLTRRPWEYFWCYKRFKYKINRDVLLLSDDKIGHFKQTQALCSFLEEDGRYQIRKREVVVSFRWPWLRFFADTAALLVPKHSISSWFWLKVLLDDKTAEALKNVYADIVISTGSFVAPATKLMASYLGAKSACVLRANFPLDKFNLTIIPEHDRISADNTITVKGALVYPQKICEKGKECFDFFNLRENKKMSLFIGGPLNSDDDFLINLKIFMAQVKDFSIKKGYDVLISTSRRTPHCVETYLENIRDDFKAVKAVVIANKHNYDFVFEGFISLADVVFVTSESISMVSEVASLSDACVCVFLEKSDNKRNLFLDSVKDEIVMLHNPYDIKNIPLKRSAIFEKNREKITKRVGVLF
jgi:lauroyl/myristoyl acyltransferase/mitochondrial fission protein ELM1